MDVYFLTLISGMMAIGIIMLLGFRRNDKSFRELTERFTIAHIDTQATIKEMSRKTDELVVSNKELVATSKELAIMNKDNGIFLRMILERVDKNK